MIIAAQIRAARALLGIDQRALAELAGVSLPTIQRMEASTGEVRGTVDNPQRRLKAEMYVTVEIVGEVQAGADIPSEAVFLKDNKSYVYLERGPGRFERREVRLGAETDGRIAVLAGLPAGQRVVTEGCLLLQSMMDAGGQP